MFSFKASKDSGISDERLMRHPLGINHLVGGNATEIEVERVST